MNNNEKAPVTQPTGNTLSDRQHQARNIMQQLVSEGIFAPGEAAEITFSDSKIIAIPEDEHTNNKSSENE